MQDQISDYLNKKLLEAFSEKWANRPEMRYEILEEGSRVVLKVHGIGRKSKQPIEIVTEVLPLLQTREEVDDYLSEIFSKMLELHMRWPN